MRSRARAVAKRATNVSIRSDLPDAAREAGVNLWSRRPAHHQHSAVESDTPRAMIMFVRVPAPSPSTI
jgi:hypothetical protein